MSLRKSATEVRQLRRAGAIVGDALRLLRQLAVPGARLSELDAAVAKLIRARGAQPTFRGYQGFPASICASVNEEAVHGLPDGRRLREGDLVSFDVGATFDGWVGDSAISVCVGGGSAADRALVAAACDALHAAIAAARVGAALGDLGAAVEAVVRPRGYGIVESYCGHGIGCALHEDPVVPNVGTPGQGPRIEDGWCLAIEPVITAGSGAVALRPDGWTVATLDGGRAAHVELAVAITAAGVEILTLTSDGELP